MKDNRLRIATILQTVLEFRVDRVLVLRGKQRAQNSIRKWNRNEEESKKKE